MALQKFVHKVSPELTQDAQFKSYGAIPGSQLTPGTTVKLYPGTYSNVTVANGITIEGVGGVHDVTLPGITVSSGTSGNVVVRNVTLTAAGNAFSTAVGTTATVKLQECHLTGSTHGVPFTTSEGNAVCHEGSGAITLQDTYITGPWRSSLRTAATANIIGGVITATASGDHAVWGGAAAKGTVRFVNAALRGAGKSNVTGGATIQADTNIGRGGGITVPSASWGGTTTLP